jgi:large subunit ribosomal protein L6
MSRIGKLPVAIPNGVSVELSEGTISAKGPQGTLACGIPPYVSVSQEDNQIVVTRLNDEQKARSMHGLARTLINNLIEGVNKGFSKSLEINGVGYTVELKKEYLIFNLGYSHPIYYELPEGIKVSIEGKNKVTVAGSSRQVVGASAAKIRSFRPPEPYKGKGVKYTDEVIRRKEGKSGGR